MYNAYEGKNVFRRIGLICKKADQRRHPLHTQLSSALHQNRNNEKSRANNTNRFHQWQLRAQHG